MSDSIMSLEQEISQMEERLQKLKEEYEHKKRMLRQTCTHTTYRVMSDWNYKNKGYMFVCDTCKLIMKDEPKSIANM